MKKTTKMSPLPTVILTTLIFYQILLIKKMNYFFMYSGYRINNFLFCM